MTAVLLGPNDEPQGAGTIVVVHCVRSRDQEAFVRSGLSNGSWYPLGGEFRCPDYRRGEIPQHPQWEDVVARGPVTLLVATDDDSYRRGWRAGRRDLWQAMEVLAEDDPPGTTR